LRTDAIHIPLRKDRAEPGGEAAAALIVVEERLALCLGFAETEQVCVERIREIARTA
jgi:hypothetical protein